MRYIDSTMKRRSFIAILLLLSITLFGCANGGSMRFEVGPNLSDADFGDSLEKLHQFTSGMSYSYGEVRFAPVAWFSVNGRKLDTQRLLVMDGGLFLVSHNMIDDQFYPVAYFAYSQISGFFVGSGDIASGSLSQGVSFSTTATSQEKAMNFTGTMWEGKRASELLAFVSAKLDEK